MLIEPNLGTSDVAVIDAVSPEGQSALHARFDRPDDHMLC